MYHTFKKKKKKKKKTFDAPPKVLIVANLSALQTERTDRCATRLDQVVAAYRRLNWTLLTLSITKETVRG